ncbi:MAG: site-specific DNA-methyltransferase [Pleurocapsa sp. SU_196_0]|nr:site-specific DNA-methyltransferase [Pleurocapsa sp. SU_196_0]
MPSRTRAGRSAIASCGSTDRLSEIPQPRGWVRHGVETVVGTNHRRPQTPRGYGSRELGDLRNGRVQHRRLPHPDERCTHGSGSAPLKHGGQNHRPFHDTAIPRGANPSPLGRWPANLIHDGSPEVLEGFPETDGQKSRALTTGERQRNNVYDDGRRYLTAQPEPRTDFGSAARFFYCAKASREDRNEGLPSSDTPAVAMHATMRDREDADWTARNGNHHPTVKPKDLMRYLVRLVTPPGGLVLDPFMGSGSTGKAAALEGLSFIGIELEAEFVEIARARIAHASQQGHLFAGLEVAW